MKKFCLILTLSLLIQPAFCSTYYFKTVNSNLIPPYYPVQHSQVRRGFSNVNMNNPDMLFLQGLLANSALYTGRLNPTATPALRNNKLDVLSYLDPYIIRIDGNDYVLVKDNEGGNWSIKNILGYNDSKKNLFASLKKLESDGNASKITSQELQKANIRFVKLNIDGSLALNERKLDYDINKVLYIDMKNLRTALGNKNQNGTFGYFYVYIKDKNGQKVVPGRVTFEEKSELHNYIK